MVNTSNASNSPAFDALLTTPGIHRVDVSRIADVLAAAGRSDIEVHRVARVTNRADLHDRMQRSWSFPRWYGRNFDALADALTDLSWRAPAARTLVIGPLTAFYVSDPDGYETLIDVLADATEGWKETSTPLSVIELVPDGHGGPSV